MRLAKDPKIFLRFEEDTLGLYERFVCYEEEGTIESSDSVKLRSFVFSNILKVLEK